MSIFALNLPMGQKSRNKKHKQPQVKPVQKTVPSLVTSTQSVAEGPSLVQSSTTFKAKGPGAEELLQVRQGDIAKIAWLIGVMVVLFIALGIVNAHTSLLQTAGKHLSAFMRI
jgi:hypothetical protein